MSPWSVSSRHCLVVANTTPHPVQKGRGRPNARTMTDFKLERRPSFLKGIFHAPQLRIEKAILRNMPVSVSRSGTSPLTNLSDSRKNIYLISFHGPLSSSVALSSLNADCMLSSNFLLRACSSWPQTSSNLLKMSCTCSHSELILSSSLRRYHATFIWSGPLSFGDRLTVGSLVRARSGAPAPGTPEKPAKRRSMIRHLSYHLQLAFFPGNKLSQFPRFVRSVNNRGNRRDPVKTLQCHKQKLVP